MEFSKCKVERYKGRVSFQFKEDMQIKEGGFALNGYESHAYFGKLIKPNINRYILVTVFALILFVWILISDNYGGASPEFKQIDNFVMPFLMILTFATAILDVCFSLNFVRFFLGLPFYRYNKFLVIVLKNEKEYEIPVKSQQEADQIIEYILKGKKPD